MQSTAPHWTLMLEEVTADTLTEGAGDGAGDLETLHTNSNGYLSPASRVIAVIVLLTALLPAALLAVTVML